MSEKLETAVHVYLIFELFEGVELFEIVRKQQKLSENIACHYFYCLLKTVLKLSETGIAHRDIKAENIVVDEVSNDIKLLDFGFAVECGAGKKVKHARGSPHYSAPEVLANEAYDPLKADIWSAGVLLFFMLCGRPAMTRIPAIL